MLRYFYLSFVFLISISAYGGSPDVPSNDGGFTRTISSLIRRCVQAIRGKPTNPEASSAPSEETSRGGGINISQLAKECGFTIDPDKKEIKFYDYKKALRTLRTSDTSRYISYIPDYESPLPKTFQNVRVTAKILDFIIDDRGLLHILIEMSPKWVEPGKNPRFELTSSELQTSRESESSLKDFGAVSAPK